MGKTSTASKAKYNAKAYDRLAITIKKGERDIIKTYAESIGKSLNGYINDLIVSDMEKNGIKLRPVIADKQASDQ